jgi:ribosome-binding protein aMBF1 (putative translation factor)
MSSNESDGPHFTNGRPQFSADNAVGSSIRSRREELGLSRGTLAALLSFAEDDIQKIEAGTLRAAPLTLSLLTTHLRVPISYFFTSINERERPPHVAVLLPFEKS